MNFGASSQVSKSGSQAHSISSIYNKALAPPKQAVDKSSILWKDFINGIKRRKDLVNRLREAATDSAASMNVLKRQLLEIRQLTLTLIEDALEIEYTYRIHDPNAGVTKTSSKPAKLPPISSFRSMEEKEDIFALAEIINDVDVLFTIPNIRVMLPKDFPNKRNPFLLGKSVDELAELVPPNPESGNMEEELKVLELHRYKRASKALIRAEAQILNNLPLTLHDMERLLVRMTDDINIEKLVRSVCTILDNDRVGLVTTETPEIRCLMNPIFNIEAYDLLTRLNRFKGTYAMRIDVQVLVRQHLQECNFDYLDDPTSRFLLDWLNLILSQSLVQNKAHGTDGQSRLTGSTKPRSKSQELGPNGRAVSPLTKKNLAEHNYSDLASEIGSVAYNRGTHENIYTEQAPRMKVRASSAALALADAHQAIRPSSRPDTDAYGTGTPIAAAIQAGRKAAQISSRPNSRGNVRSPSNRPRTTSEDHRGSPTNFTGSDYMPPLYASKSDVQVATLHNTQANAGLTATGQPRTPLSPAQNRRKPGSSGGVSATARQAQAEEAEAKLRQEIEKVVRQMGLQTSPKKPKGLHGKKDEEDVELDRLSSVRYELHRMQQELLRRQVLDPRHYQVMSVDAIAQAQSGLTVSEINTSHPDAMQKQKLLVAAANAQKLIILSEKTVSSVKSRDGSCRNNITVELCLDLVSEVLIARINAVQETGGDEVETNESIISGSVAFSERKVLKREILGHTRLSRLIYNRITDYLLSDLPSARKDAKGKMLQNVFEAVTERALERPPPSGFFLMKANRVLMAHKFTEDGILVDLVIMRNDLCDGLIIHCTPLAGIFNAAPHTNAAGPVTIHLHDKELQVLLINQYGLFLLSRVKWSSMELVAQWLSGRLIVRKVKTIDTSAPAEEEPSMFEDNGLSQGMSNLILEEPSFVSQVTFDNTARVQEADGRGETRVTIVEPNNSHKVDSDGAMVVSHSGDRVVLDPPGYTGGRSERAVTPGRTLTMPGFIDMRAKTPQSPFRQSRSQGGPRRTLAMLDVQLDRRVDVSHNLQLQWKSRNVPNITGMEMALYAWQDLEMLRIRIVLTLPLPHRFNLLRKKNARAGKKNSDLMDMNEFSDGDDDLTDSQFGQVEPVTIELAYRLTSAELSIFGSAEMIEAKKITLSENLKLDAEQQHPETFIWNVFCRLKVCFKGSNIAPFEKHLNANDSENWEIQYNRKLVRDVKTISKGVMVLTVSAIGTELLFEAEPLDNSVYHQVGSKIMSEEEISDTVHTEGWPLKLLDYHERKTLALKMCDKMKVVDEATAPRLEIYTFPETRMLRVMLHLGPRDHDFELGNVEINYHSTLSDVRVLIKHELDYEDVPKQFRFLYKGASCSVKQEPFRRAWECLPFVQITAKAVETHDNGTETEEMMRRREKIAKKVVVELPKLPKGQRRVLGKFAAVPVPTLVYVTEGRGEVHCLHDCAGLFEAGDIIRIGHTAGRDYIVLPTPQEEAVLYPKTMQISPVYDLASETDFSTPIQNNFAYPKKGVGKYYDPVLDFSYEIIASPSAQGFDFLLPPSGLDAVEVGGGEINPADGPSGGLGQSSVASELDAHSSMASVNTADLASIQGRVMYPTGSNMSHKSGKRRMANASHPHSWIWKCIPLKEDHRPKWRVQYDNGAVPYNYEFRGSTECHTHFRVPANFGYLEVLCTDSRVPQFTLHAQRVDDMEEIPLERYTELAFSNMTEWSPQCKKGIERSKFIKLMRDVTAFPDLKRSARISQLEMYFLKILKSEHGIAQKFINYAGFCQLLKEIALIRYPPPKRQREGEGKPGDGSTVGSVDDNASVGSVGSLGEASAGSFGSNDRHSLESGMVSADSLIKKEQKKRATAGFAARKGKRRKLAAENEDDETSVGASIHETDPVYVLMVYKKFVIEFVMMYPDWYDTIWREAKLMAMKRAAVPYCAATRIQAKVRGGQARTRFRFFLRNHIVLQANIRRKLSAKKTNAFIAILRQDWCFRMRYHYATLIQTLVRKFCKRCWFHRAIQKIKEGEYLVQKARRFRLKKLRAAARKGILYKELKRVNGVMVYIRLTRQDTRNYTRDCGLTIEVYVPEHQSTFRFPLDDAELRLYMQMELQVDAVSVGDLLDKRNLQRLVASRLMIHKPTSKFATTQVIFSKHGLGQRGENMLTRGKRIKGELFVCKIFETGDDIAVQCYHRHTSKVFNVHMSIVEMREWIMSEWRLHVRDELERNSEPFVLRPGNKRAYYEWVLNGITIDTRKGAFKVLFAIHLMKSRKKEMIIKIQSIWRKALARPKIVAIVDQILLKVRVSAQDPTIYYLNRQTGATTWVKSKLLGNMDIPTEAVYQWVPLTYYDKNGVPQTHYVNPYNGKYTYMVPEQAAKTIQHLVRNFLLRALAMPLADFVKAGKIFRTAEYQYFNTNRRLATVINFAMVSHVINLDEPLAKKLYAEAVELSEANPLVTRAYAFFMMGTCEAPILKNRERAQFLFADARRKDEYSDKFRVAYNLFQFACLRNPMDFRTLVNLALVQCLIYGNNYNAEKLMRRALAIAPFEERVVEIWNYLKDRFPERHLVYNPNSRVHKIDVSKDTKTRILHGRPVKENRQWAGWCYVEKDTYNVSKQFKDEPYWYNPADGTELLNPPDMNEQWHIRRQRSLFEGEMYGLENYFDPLTSEYFQYHPLTRTFA